MKKKTWPNMAKLIKSKRITHPKGYSQGKLSKLLEYKNGQFISNIERGLCGVPAKVAKKMCDILDIPEEDFIKAFLADEEHYLRDSLKHGSV